MSIHRSLKVDRFRDKRSVRKRYERLEKLVRTEKFVEKLGIYGLPKEKIISIKFKIKKEKKEVSLADIATLAEIKNEEKNNEKTNKDGNRMDK